MSTPKRFPGEDSVERAGPAGPDGGPAPAPSLWTPRAAGRERARSFGREGGGTEAGLGGDLRGQMSGLFLPAKTHHLKTELKPRGTDRETEAQEPRAVSRADKRGKPGWGAGGQARSGPGLSAEPSPASASGPGDVPGATRGTAVGGRVCTKAPLWRRIAGDWGRPCDLREGEGPLVAQSMNGKEKPDGLNGDRKEDLIQ